MNYEQFRKASRKAFLLEVLAVVIWLCTTGFTAFYLFYLVAVVILQQ